MEKKLSYILLGGRATGKTYFREYIVVENIEEYASELVKIMKLVEDKKLALESGVKLTPEKEEETLKEIEEFSIKYKRNSLLDILSKDWDFRRKINGLYNEILKLYNDFFFSSKEIGISREKMGMYEITIVDIPGEFIENLRRGYMEKLEEKIRELGLEHAEVFVFITDIILPSPKGEIYPSFSVRDEIKIKNLKKTIDLIKKKIESISFYYLISKFDKRAFYGLIPGFFKIIEKIKEKIKETIKKGYILTENENYETIANFLFRKMYGIDPPENIRLKLEIDESMDFLEKISLKILENIINHRLDYIVTLVGEFPIKRSSVAIDEYSPWKIILENILENYELRRIKK